MSVLLFDRDVEVAKLQDAFVQSFLQEQQQMQQFQQQKQYPQEENENNTEDDSNSQAGASMLEQQQRRQQQRRMTESTTATGSTSGSGSSKKKKYKKKRMQQLLQEAKNLQQQEQQQQQQQQHTAQRRPRHVAILVSPAGTGKTTLVHAALESLLEQTNGYFLSSGDTSIQSTSDASLSSSTCSLPPPLTVFAKIITQWTQQIMYHQQLQQQQQLQEEAEYIEDTILEKLQRQLERTMDQTEIQSLLQVVPIFKQVMRGHTTITETNSGDPTTTSTAAAAKFQHPNNFAVTVQTVLRAIASAIGDDDTPVVLFLDDLHHLVNLESDTNSVLDLSERDSSVDGSSGNDDHSSGSAASSNNSRGSNPNTSRKKGLPNSGITNLSPTKTMSSANWTLQLVQSLILDVHYIPNLMVVLAFQPVPYDHPITSFLQQLENATATAQSQQQVFKFVPIVPKHLTETSHVYEWLQHHFAEQTDVTAETWRDMSTQIIHHPLLSAHGNPLAISLVLESLSNTSQTFDLSLKDALKMMVAKLEQIQKRQAHNKAAKKQQQAEAPRTKRHGRRFHSQQDPSTTPTTLSSFSDSFGSLSSFGNGAAAYEDFSQPLNDGGSNSRRLNAGVDDPVVTVLMRHIATIVDTKIKPASKRLCQLITCYCAVPSSMVMSTETLKYAWVALEGKANVATLKEAVGEVVGCGLFRLVAAPALSGGRPQHFLVFGCSTFRDVLYNQLMTSREKIRCHAKLASSLFGVSVGGEAEKTESGMMTVVPTSADLFTTFAHWQRGFDDLASTKQQTFARLCLQAGNAAMEWSQYEVACGYFAIGIKALDHCVAVAAIVTTATSTAGNPLSPLSPVKKGGGGGGGAAAAAASLSPLIRHTKNRAPTTAWTLSIESYNTNLALHLGVATACAYLNQFDDAEQYLQEVVYQVKHSSNSRETSTKSIVERAQVTYIRLLCHMLQQNHSDAIHLGSKSLQKLGEGPLNIVVTASGASTGQTHAQTNESELKSIRRLLGGLIKRHGNASNDQKNMRAIAEAVVESLEPMSYEKSFEAMKVYDLLLASVVVEFGSLIATIAGRIVKLALQTGNLGGICPPSAVGFATMGSIFYAGGDVEHGSLCEHIGNGIYKIFQDKASRGRMLVIQNSLALPRHGFSEQLKVACRLCDDVSDNDFAMISRVISVSDLFVTGGPLNATAEAMKGVYQVLSSRNNQRLLFVVRPLFQMALNLMGVEATTNAQGDPDEHYHPYVLEGTIIKDVKHEIQYAKETHNVKAEFAIYLAQATLCFYLHKFDQCRVAIEHCYELPRSEFAVLASLEVQWLFLDAMSAICVLWKQSKTNSTISKEMAKLKKQNVEIVERCVLELESFSVSSPDLVEQKILMIQGELMVLSGQIDDALSAFQRAMEHSEGYDVLSDRALACERAGLALRATHREDEALDFLEDSMAFYREYGALAKVNHVKGNVIPGWDD
ncbi:AAA ATPase domain containing protein [Nitzschia inconspicua]|uniref:AAA ATPase domain containing protein n=1 Tax=Nitzschia inconspicua TaxID=303405 RepID=A0A9K3K807_9STRA|nr:AAA ATPase domain containing protein [Nitzschia inconspicua]KAG7350026.1 AAA ATPase domain containing protein [Nitzschia inconspicua]KAG7373710.1 AAA ATPase domain containing protein [Nitzschia inconspicua]